MPRRIPVFDNDSEPLNDSWTKWGLGVVIPALIATVGISRFFIRQMVLPGRYGFRMSLTGNDAIAAGVILISLALYMFSHNFMSNSDRLASHAGLGKVVALLLGIVSFGYVLLHAVTTF